MSVAIPISQTWRLRIVFGKRLACFGGNRFRSGVLAVADTFEEREAFGVRTGNDVCDAVSVEVREPRTKTDASSGCDFRNRTPSLKPLESVEFWCTLRTDVPVDSKLSFAKLTHEQVRETVPVEVGEGGRCMAYVNFDGIRTRLHEEGLRQFDFRCARKR